MNFFSLQIFAAKQTYPLGRLDKNKIAHLVLLAAGWFRLICGHFFLHSPHSSLGPMVNFVSVPWHLALRNIHFSLLYFRCLDPAHHWPTISAESVQYSSSLDQTVYLNFNGHLCSRKSFSMMANADIKKRRESRQKKNTNFPFRQ